MGDFQFTLAIKRRLAESLIRPPIIFEAGVDAFIELGAQAMRANAERVKRYLQLSGQKLPLLDALAFAFTIIVYDQTSLLWRQLI